MTFYYDLQKNVGETFSHLKILD